jgi:hypothetical protein
MIDILDFFSKTYYKLVGNNKLRYYEMFCLDEWKKHLNNDEKDLLEKQLSMFDYISREPYGLKTVFYSIRDPEFKSWGKKDFFSNLNSDLKVFSGTIVGHIGDIEISIEFDIFAHKGRIFSIEFKNETKLLMQAEGLKILKGRVINQV